MSLTKYQFSVPYSQYIIARLHLSIYLNMVLVII